MDLLPCRPVSVATFISGPAGWTFGTSIPSDSGLNQFAGDLDGDGAVNGIDLGLLLVLWATDDPLADLDGSGVVGASDLELLLEGWTE